MYKNCFGLFLSAHFLFGEILNLNLTFAVYVKRKLSNKVRLRSFPETWLAGVTSVSVWFRSKGRPRNGIFGFSCSSFFALKPRLVTLDIFHNVNVHDCCPPSSRKVTGGTFKNKGHVKYILLIK